ncbi:MAG: hypothetical protein MZW92_69510 [Comamonadaceae bacterium]|nr:hypothetical protein [Comamonadaceae bacterium]
MAFAAGAQNTEPKVLNVYNWADYIADDTIEELREGNRHQGPLRQLRQQRDPARQAGGRPHRLRHRRARRALRQDADRRRPVPEARPVAARRTGRTSTRRCSSSWPRSTRATSTSSTWLWGYVTVGINVDKVKAALGATPMPANPLGPDVQARVRAASSRAAASTCSTRPPRCCRWR